MLFKLDHCSYSQDLPLVNVAGDEPDEAGAVVKEFRCQRKAYMLVLTDGDDNESYDRSGWVTRFKRSILRLWREHDGGN
jgi:hypothetical protein